MKTQSKFGELVIIAFLVPPALFSQTTLWNTGFESGDSLCTSNVTTGTATQPNSDNAKTGSYSGKLAGASGANNPYDGSIISSLITFSSNKLYKYTVYAKVAKCTGKLEIRKSATASNAALKNATGEDAILTSGSSNVTSSSYSIFTGYFTVSSNESKYLGFQMTSGGCGGTGSAIMYIDDVLIQEMDHPTWLGGSSIAWATATNWSINDVPSKIMNITIPSGTSYNCNIGSTTVAYCNNLTINLGASLSISTTAGLGYLDIYGNFMNNGTLNHTGSASIFMNGSSKTLGGTGDFSGNTKLYAWNGSTTTLSNNLSLNQLTIYNNASSSFSLSSYTLSIENSLTQSGILNFNSGTLEYAGTATPTLTESRFNEDAGTMYYSALTANICVADGITYNNLKININHSYTSHFSCSASTYYDFTIGGNLEFINPDAGSFGTAHLHQNITVNGNITIAAGTTFESNSKNITLKGNWLNNGNFDASTALVKLNGTGNQDIGGSNSTSFFKLTIDKSSGSTTLSKNTTVTNVLTLTNGQLDLNSKTLTLTKTHASAPTGTQNSISRTNGSILSENTSNLNKIIWFVGTIASHSFPLGNAAGTYIPFIFNALSGTSGNVTLSSYPTGNDNTPYPATVTNMLHRDLEDNSQRTINRFWQIDLASALTADITFTYSETDVPPLGEADLVAQRWNGSKWESPISGQTLNTSNNTVLVPSVSSFSPWTLSSAANPLPVALNNFEVSCSNDYIYFEWSTASELGNDYFTLEQSVDAEIYIPIKKINGSGFSNSLSNYKTAIPNIDFTNYYRLKQTDYDGTSKIIATKALNCGSLEQSTVLLYPNPANSHTEIKIRIPEIEGSEINLSIFDLSGRLLSKDLLLLDNTMFSIAPALEKGIYNLVIETGNKIFKKVLIVN